MKKIIASVMLVLLALSGCSSANNQKETLKVFAPGVYIDESLIGEFESEFNCEVIYENFDSNESMYTKLLGGDKYDVLVPSDYMIERLIQENKLQKLDFNIVNNMDGVIPTLLNSTFDPNQEYSAPYFWGTVGLLYNTKNVDIQDLESQGWNILHNEKYAGKVFFYDSERDAFMAAEKALGYSMNTTNQDELNASFEWLKTMNQVIKPIYLTDEVIDRMLGSEKDIAMMYSGDAAYIMSENADMDFFLPAEGTNIFNDAMVVPTDAKNPSLANKWIQFMLREENALANSIFVGYSSPIQSVYDQLGGVGGDYEGNSAYQPRLGYEKDETFNYNDEVKKIIADLWLKAKAQQ